MNKITEAAIFAAKAHDGQVRKMVWTPYIFHPIEVGQIVTNMTDDEDTICAAILHDTVEDTPVTLEEIEEKFGPRVRELVAGETENKRENQDPSETWMVRKQESLDELEATKDLELKKMWLGDKLSNIRSLYKYNRDKGGIDWNMFHNTNPADHEWYYRSIKYYLRDLAGYPSYKEYCDIVDILFGGEDEK